MDQRGAAAGGARGGDEVPVGRARGRRRAHARQRPAVRDRVCQSDRRTRPMPPQPSCTRRGLLARCRREPLGRRSAAPTSLAAPALNRAHACNAVRRAIDRRGRSVGRARLGRAQPIHAAHAPLNPPTFARWRRAFTGRRRAAFVATATALTAVASMRTAAVNAGSRHRIRWSARPEVPTVGGADVRRCRRSLRRLMARTAALRVVEQRAANRTPCTGHCGDVSAAGGTHRRAPSRLIFESSEGAVEVTKLSAVSPGR